MNYKQLKKKIIYLFFPRKNMYSKISRLDRRVASMIKYILENNNISIEAIHFTDFKVYNKKNKIIVVCEMIRPGLFIGVGGKTLDLVTYHLTNYYNKEIKILIKEKILFN